MSHSDLMKVGEVAAWLNVSESAIYKWVKEGTFPKPFKLSPADSKRSASRWSRSDIAEWLEARRDDT